MNTYNEIFFTTLKDGDILGFYKPGIFSWIIDRFSENKDVKISHVGVVYNVKREDSYLTFEVSEQTATHGGVMTKWTVQKGMTGFYFSNPYKQKVLYFKSLKKPFRALQIEKGLKDAKLQVGRKYGFWTLPFSLPLVSKIIGKLHLGGLFSNSRVCSKHVATNHFKAGRVGSLLFLENNPNPSPEGIFFYNEYDFESNHFKIDL